MPHTRSFLCTILITLIVIPSVFAFPVPVPCDNTRVAGVPTASAALAPVLRLPVIPAPLMDLGALLPVSATRIPRDATPGGTQGESALLQARGWSLSPGIRFTENRGQIVDSDGGACPYIRFVANAQGARLYFTNSGVSTVFSRTENQPPRVSEATGKPMMEAQDGQIQSERIVRYRMDLHFEGANPDAQIRAESECGGYSNYYLGHCPDGITQVKSYARLVYVNLYDQIDLVYTASPQRVKYEFIVHAGGDPSRIRLRYEGAIAMQKSEDGSLVISSPLGSIAEEFPYSYQGEKAVEAEFMIEGSVVGFHIGEYNVTKPLVIDPWATYHGGSAEDYLVDVETDAAGNIFAGGGTSSLDFPIQNGFQPAYGGGIGDLFITKFSPVGALLWSTYYGGSGHEALGWNSPPEVQKIAVSVSGTCYLGGETHSTDFPVSSNAFQSTLLGSSDAAIIVLDGGGLRSYASYYGGSATEFAAGTAVDANGNFAVVGMTLSTDFPVYNAFQSVTTPGFDAFVVRFDAAFQRTWATALGGSNSDDCAYAAAFDATGALVLAGRAGANTFPGNINAFQNASGGLWDGFFTKFSASGAMQWSTFFGGAGDDAGTCLFIDAANNIYGAGYTSSANFPVSNGYQNSFQGGNSDAFLVKFTPAGMRTFSSYFGGSGDDHAYDIKVRGTGNIHITGSTGSADLPVLNAHQQTKAANLDAFVAVLSSNLALEWATYFGGSENEGGLGLALGSSGAVILGILTYSGNLYTLNPQQSSYGGNGDGFIVSLAADGQLTPPTVPSAPTALSASAISPSRARLQWVDNAGNESSYIIETNPDGAGWQVLKTVPANTVSDIITNLLPLSTYQFRVKAANAQYHSAYSNTASVTMPAFAAPSNLRATAVSISRIELQWQDNSTNEDMFIVEKSNNGSIWSAADTTGASVATAVIGGLEPSTLWYFRVRAVEGVTSSPWSNTATATTFDFPAPANLIAAGHSAGTIQLDWEDRSVCETGFIVELRALTGTWYTADTVGENVTSCISGGLLSSTTYEARVHAFAEGVSSSNSNTAQATTLLFLETPANLAVALLSETSVRLTWEDRSTQETGFEVEQKEGINAWIMVRTTAADEEGCDLGGLMPRTSYFFRVRAVGPGAASEYSHEVAMETHMKPASPLNLLATAVDSRSVRITWQRGSSNEESCELQRKIHGGAWATITATGPGNGNVLDEGLELTTTYWYRVRAINSLGASDWSNEDSATTYDVAIPESPFALRASATMPTAVRLAWGMPAGSYVEGFEIEQSPTGDEGSFARVLPDAGPDDREYTVPGLLPNANYYFRVRAFNRSGASGYSNVLRVLTTNVNYPAVPFGLTAAASSDTQIELGWSMPDPPQADGFEIEQSLTGGEDDFTKLSPDAGSAARSYSVKGLLAYTRYYFRLRAVNQYGKSVYTDIANAMTLASAIDPQLLSAMQSKEALFPGLENLIADGGAEIAALRTLFGDYARGYDEVPARTLIASWLAAYPDDQATAAEALERYTLFEQALGSGFHDVQFTPPLEGAWEISREASGVPAMLTKDACALALAWASQRNALGTENPYVDAAVEDLLLPVSDGAETMLGLMGANNNDVVNAFTEQVLLNKGEVTGLTSRSLLSVLNYWQERMAAQYYFSATQPAITAFADKCAQQDIGDTRQSAIAKRDGFVLAVRNRTDALSLGYTPYAGVCTGLDAAYTIGQTLAPTVEIFLQRLTQLRPRLVDGMYKAITDADIPVERFLYLASTDDIAGLDPLPYSLTKAGDAIYHPEIPGPPAGTVESGNTVRQPGTPTSSPSRPMAADPAIDFDRTALITLRENVVSGDAAYAATEFGALRRSGREMTAAIVRMERPLFGIAPADMYQQAALREHYYGTLARSNRLKTRRTVLSVALADYALSPTAQKQTSLIAEIDSIIGPLNDVLSGIGDLIGGPAGAMITMPVLSLANADIVRNEAAGPTRCRLRFILTNLGGALAAQPQVEIVLYSEGVTVQGATSFIFGDLAVSESAGDSLALDIPVNTAAVTLSAMLRSGGHIFTDRRTLTVPQSTTEVEAAKELPASCILHQNHPNPLRPTTTISFTLPRESAVTVVVTDVLGREVARPCHAERRGTGTHSVTFDARDLPTGVYLYRLQVEGSTLVRKMVVMK